MLDILACKNVTEEISTTKQVQIMKIIHTNLKQKYYKSYAKATLGATFERMHCAMQGFM